MQQSFQRDPDGAAAPRIEVGRRVRYHQPYGNRVDGVIVEIRGTLTGEKPRPGVMQFIRHGQATFDVITFDGRLIDNRREHDVGSIGIGAVDLLDKVHGPALIERARRLVAERAATDNLAKITAREAFEAAEAARVITDPPVFYWNGIKDAKGEKLQRAYYSDGTLNRHPEGTITIYARGYTSFSAKVCACLPVANNSDSMTDYFERDRIRVLPVHPLYAQVKAAMEAADAVNDRRQAKRAGGAA